MNNPGLSTDNPKVLTKIKSIFQKQEEKDIWLELSNEQKSEINAALKDVEEGKTIDYDAFLAKHKKWLAKLFFLTRPKETWEIIRLPDAFTWFHD